MSNRLRFLLFVFLHPDLCGSHYGRAFVLLSLNTSVRSSQKSRIVVPGDGVEPRTFGFAASDDGVGHADDGRGVHAAAEFGKYRAIGAEPTLDGFRKDGAEVLFVFGVGPVTDPLARIEIPILADDVFSGSENSKRGWRDGMYADVRRQMRGGKGIENQPAMYSSQIAKVFPAKRTSGSRIVHQVTWLLSNE